MNSFNNNCITKISQLFSGRDMYHINFDVLKF